MTCTIDVETPNGPGRWLLDRPRHARALLALGHGAGGGPEAFDLAVLARELPARSIAVARFESPWHVAGRKVAGSPKTLDEAWRLALPCLPKLPLIVGGRSAGARVACRCLTAPALGVVTLSFPLHPPGKPDKSRASEAIDIANLLVLQGEKDPFGSPGDIAAALRQAVVVTIDGATHSLAPRSGEESVRTTQLIEPVATFVENLL